MPSKQSTLSEGSVGDEYATSSSNDMSEDELTQVEAPKAYSTHVLGKRERTVSLLQMNTSKNDARDPPALRKRLEDTVVEENIKKGVAALRQALELSPTATRGHKLVQLLLEDLRGSKTFTFSSSPSATKQPEATAHKEAHNLEKLVKELATTVKQMATQLQPQQQQQQQHQQQRKPTFAEAARKNATGNHLATSQTTRAPQLAQSQHAAPKQTTRQQKKQDIQNRQLILVLEDSTAAAAVCPLEQRNAINQALAKISPTPVVASVNVSARKNLVLTTTESYNAAFLLQNAEHWKAAVKVAYKEMQKQEEWALLVAHRVYAHPQFLSSPKSLKAEIETFNNIAIKGNVRWLAKPEKLEALSTKHPDYRYAPIVFAVENKEVARQLLAKKQISIAGRVVYLAKYHDVSEKTQCTSCYKLGHNKEMCKRRGCKFCAEAHYTKDHQSCKECKTTGRLCAHQKPNCTNCKGEHIATSSACSHRSKTTNASVPL